MGQKIPLADISISVLDRSGVPIGIDISTNQNGVYWRLLPPGEFQVSIMDSSFSDQNLSKTVQITNDCYKANSPMIANFEIVDYSDYEIS